MKVLHCFDKYLPNTENWAYRLISNLKGIKVVITTEIFLKNNFYSRFFDYIELPVYPVEQPVTGRKVLIRIANFLILNIRKIYPYYLRTLAKDVEIVHSHFALTGWKYYNILKKHDHIISFYGYDYEQMPFKQPIWKERYQRLFKEAKLFICEGNHGVEILVKQGCAPEKIKVVRLGVEVDKIPKKNRLKRSKELKLVQIASFTEKKGHYYTVASFIKALDDCPDMHLTIVGGDKDGVSRKQVIELIAAKNIGNKVSLLESIDFDKLYDFLEEYQVFIHPSCYAVDMDCEGGAPVVLLDAQATGMPIISTRHCDIPDEVIDGKTGLLTEEKDIEGLSRAIREFYYMSQEQYDTFSIAARKHVELNFDSKKNSKVLEDIYRSLKN